MLNPASRILVVDDSDSMRQLLDKILSALGFANLAQATNGEEAWRKIREALAEKKPFDLIFCDWNMPEMTGLDLLRRIRATTGTEKLRVVMLTGVAEKELVLQAVQLGVSDYVKKPFSATSIQEALGKL